MACNKCHQDECCCTQIISKTGERGKTGPPGPSIPTQVGVLSGNIGRQATDGSGSQTIVTNKKVKMVWVTVGNTNVYSNGISDGTKQHSTSNTSTAPDLSNCVDALISGNGYTAQINAADITNNSFKINWTKVGSGQDLIGHWHAIY